MDHLAARGGSTGQGCTVSEEMFVGTSAFWGEAETFCSITVLPLMTQTGHSPGQALPLRGSLGARQTGAPVRIDNTSCRV
jgi:hypothetical protein